MTFAGTYPQTGMTYEWNFNDGTLLQTGQTLVHKFQDNSVGYGLITYDVQLTTRLNDRVSASGISVTETTPISGCYKIVTKNVTI